MKTDKFISKLNIKDYNNTLEEVLLTKDFSEGAKNLLLSMLYKLENSYDDYRKTKAIAKQKKEVLEEIISIIKNECDQIEIIKLKDKDSLKEKKYIVKRTDKKIITYQNEKAILSAIYNLNTKKYTVKSEDNLVKKSLESMLNQGYIMSIEEILRDFDGWAWNVLKNDIEDYIYNITYQILVYLVGNDVIDNKEINEKNIEAILKNNYKKTTANNIYKLLIQISILKFIQNHKKEREDLIKEQEQLEEKFTEIDNKKLYIQKITNRKKTILKELREIDKIINDDLALKREFIKRNEMLPENEKIFSLSDFSENINKKRENLLKERQECTSKLEPTNYLKEKEIIENRLNFIKELEIITKKNKEKTEELLKELLRYVYKAIEEQTEKTEMKKDIMNMIYKIRYLKLLPYSDNENIYELTKNNFERMERKVITKACNLRTMNIVSQNVLENYKIIKNVLNTKIIDLEKTYIKINNTELTIYDEETIEEIVTLNTIKELNIKNNKKIKLFM